MKYKVYRSAITGEYVTKEYSDDNPSTTVSETHEERPDLPEDQVEELDD